ncbi:hypothetical protein ACSS6W_011093 [Trichoderma asperelloides]|nr:hypothetical protein LI328DRAFT_164213 [Trichoderma asperelloides]
MPKVQLKKNGPSSLRQESRKQLVESLQALLANDAVSLEVLKSGSPWPSATEIARLQREKTHQKSPITLPSSSEETAVIDTALDTFRFPVGVDPDWLKSILPTFRNNSNQPNTSFSPTNSGSTSSNQDGSSDSNTIDYSPFLSASPLVQWDAFSEPGHYQQTPYSTTGLQTSQSESFLGSKTSTTEKVLHLNSLKSSHFESGGGLITPPAQSTEQPSDGDDGGRCNSPSPAPCRKRQRAHYAIEKRYRAGLQERFEALRDCVASMRQTQNEQHPRGEMDGDEEASPNDEPSRMNKAEVLHQATVCIQMLQEENEVVIEQMKLLIERLRAVKLALG